MKRCLNCHARFNEADWQCPNCQQSPAQIEGFLAFAPDLAADMEHYDPEFHNTLARLEDGHFWFEARNRLILSMLQKHFPHARNFFEIGCGTGFVLRRLGQRYPQMALSGSDLFSAGLGFTANRVPEAALFQMDARAIPFHDEFDVMGLFDVIEHITEDDAVLAQTFSAVKPGGGILITVPQHQFMWSVTDDLSYHKRRYSRQELVGKVEQAGFKVLQVTSFVSLLLPLMWISRKKSRPEDKAADFWGEFKISTTLNRILKGVMAAEYGLIQAGISFPMGGSLLLIAQRPEG